MSVLCDKSIAKLCGYEVVRVTDEYITQTPIENFNKSPMIEPFVPHQVRTTSWAASPAGKDAIGKAKKIISYGLSSGGYDVRIGNKFKIFTNVNSAVIDPLNITEKCFVDVDLDETGEDHILIPPNSYALGSTMEYFKIPKDIFVICLGKSTYARSAAIINVTPIEPEFEGEVVIEISNASALPLKIYAGQGIAQFVFFQMDDEAAVGYGTRKGKYQGQRGITLPKG